MNDKDIQEVSKLENERKSKRRKIILLTINIFGLLLLILLVIFIFGSTQLVLEEENAGVSAVQPEEYALESSYIIPGTSTMSEETIKETVAYLYKGDSNVDNLDDDHVYNEEDYVMTCAINNEVTNCENLKDQEMVTEVKGMYDDSQFNEANMWLEEKY